MRIEERMKRELYNQANLDSDPGFELDLDLIQIQIQN